MSYKARTEYYNGTGGLKLLLRHRPVFTTPTIVVHLDSGAYYGSVTGSFAGTSALTYGTDFSLKIDQEDGTSRSGILIRINEFWPKPQSRQAGFLSPFLGESFGNIRITYTAGFTVDMLPAQIRAACNLLIARMRAILPVGMEIGSESYEERSLGLITQQKNYLTSLIRPMIWPYRNWYF